MKYELLFEDINERALVCQIDALCWKEFVAPLMGTKKTSTIFVYEKGRAQAYFSEPDLKSEAKAGLEFYKKKNNLTKAIKVKKNAKKESERFNRLIKKTNLKTISTSKLLSLVKEYHKTFRRTLGAHYLTQPQIFYDIERKIIGEMNNIKDKEEKFIILTTPTKISALKKQEIELLKLALRASKKNKPTNIFLKELSKIEKKYGERAIGQGHDKWDLKFYKKELQNLVKLGEKEIKERLNKIKKHQEKLIKEQKEIKKEVKFSKITNNLVNACAELGFYRLDYTRISWTTVWDYGTKVLEEVARRLKLSLKNIENCLLFEIEALLTKEISPKGIKKELDKREKCFLYCLEHKEEMFSGEEGREKRAEILGVVNYNSISELKGFVANKGKVRGIAHVISNEDANLKRDIAKVKKGEILIVQNTWPQLLPAMQKAKAIVANEGGIASHAAIVSRELGIPCIVNTKHGTKVFKQEIK